MELSKAHCRSKGRQSKTSRNTMCKSLLSILQDTYRVSNRETKSFLSCRLSSKNKCKRNRTTIDL